MISQHGEECHLSASIAFAKGMNGIELAEEMRAQRRKALRITTSQPVPIPQPGEEPAHLRWDVLGEAEHALPLADPHRPIFPRPVTDVLKQVMVNGAIVGDREIAEGQWLVAALKNGVCFESVQGFLIA